MLIDVLLFGHHSKVQCDVSGAKERLVIVPELWLRFALQNLLCLSISDRLPRYIYFSL